MRQYSKPQLHIEMFDVEDVITVSAYISGTGENENTNWAGAPSSIEYVNDLTVDNPSGVFNAHISGGNPVQEALNTLYENFVDRM